MTSNVQMVFWGEVLDGFHADDVKRRFAQTFRLDDERLALLFSGARMVLKRSLEPAMALTYADKLARLGVRVNLEPSDAPPTAIVTPLPVLPAVPLPLVRPPPPWAAPPAAARPAPAASNPAPPPIPAVASAAPRGPEAEVTCPTCGERPSKRWLWEMTIGAAAAAQPQPRAARHELPEARHSSRPARPAPAVGLRFEGRVGRLGFATPIMASMALFCLPLILAVQEPTPGRLSVLAIAAAVLAFIATRLAVLRCHDCNRSGWWSLLLWLPGVNLIVATVLLSVAGSAGGNTYGARPAASRWRGFAAAALCVVLLLTLALTVPQLMQIIG